MHKKQNLKKIKTLFFSDNLNEDEGKINGVSKIRAVILDWINSIFLDPAVPEILYIKHLVGVSIIINFIGNPDTLMR